MTPPRGLGLVPALIAGVLLVLPSGAAAPPATISLETKPVVFSPLQPQKNRFGALEWRGGLEISAQNSHFGGFSGLVLNRDGSRMIALSDRGWWLQSELVYEGGRLAGLESAVMNQLLKPGGKPYGSKKHRDAESIISWTSGDLSDLVVSFERRHRLVRYRAPGNALTVPGRRLHALKSFKRLRYNKGLEAIARFPAASALRGWIIAVAEGTLDKAGNHLAWLLRGRSARRLSVKKRGEFEITDAAAMPGGDLILLERAVSLLGGPRFALRRIKAAHIRAGAVLDGEVLIEADLRHTIDNMEGLALHRHPDGELRLTLISDDNFSLIQRTLLLQFALRE
ncbi:MAG: twin-arginine translocation pathway signal [Hyphomicrobiales bacterium]|nr:MAG: twin-arginine translocation pathway signal [Hyphomicrobiales bacterium]